MDRSPGFGSIISDIFALLRLAFAMAPDDISLTMPLPISRRLILQQARGQTLIVLPLLVSLRFHVLFHSPTGVLFTFPSRYYFTIGHPGVFSLTRWSSLIHTGFHVPHATRDRTLFSNVFDYGTFTIYGAGFSCFV